MQTDSEVFNINSVLIRVLLNQVDTINDAQLTETVCHV